MSDERERLIEETLSAHRERDAFGVLREAAAFHDLDASGRREAFEEALRARALEAALDPEGLSTTAKAILRRLRAARGGHGPASP